MLVLVSTLQNVGLRGLGVAPQPSKLDDSIQLKRSENGIERPCL